MYIYISILAFADYTGGLNGIECNTSVVSEGIHAIHQAGGLVKVAYGGALYSMSFGVHDEYVFLKERENLKKKSKCIDLQIKLVTR